MNNKKYLDVGPGGKKCPCCFPFNRKDRKQLHRIAKRRQEKDDFIHQDTANNLQNVESIKNPLDISE